MSRRSATGVAISIAAVSLLAVGVTNAAAATTVTLNESTSSSLSINDATDDNDAITVSEAGGTITIVDTGTGGISTADVTDCTPVSATTVTCVLNPADPAPPAAPTSPVRSVNLTLNDGTDSFTNQNLDVSVSENDNGELGNKTIVSGPGNDLVATGVGNDSIDTGDGFDQAGGGPGADTFNLGSEADFVQTGTGADTVAAGPGNDQMQEDTSNDGADVFNGGPGIDFFQYFGDNPVSMSLNGVADDGPAGDGDNLLELEGLSSGNGNDTIVGDGGDNQLSGSDGNDSISGGAGDDDISPGDGADSTDAGDGNDRVSANSTEDGADLFAGGAGGSDFLDYCCGDEPVTILQDGQPNDGRVGEGDNASGFEGFSGGDAADSITGTAGADELEGNGGDDLLVGLGGGDGFSGGDGDDTLLANATAAPATSPAAGRVNRRPFDTGDELECDLGFDTAVTSAADLVAPDCERRGASVVSESASVSSKGKAKLNVACPLEEGATCKGKVVLLSNGKKIAKGKFKVANGKTKGVSAKLSKRGRKALARSGGSLFVSAEARTQEPPGVSTSEDRLQLIRSKGGGQGGGGR